MNKYLTENGSIDFRYILLMAKISIKRLIHSLTGAFVSSEVVVVLSVSPYSHIVMSKLEARVLIKYGFAQYA